MTDELAWVDAVGTAELFATGQLSAGEATHAALGRVAALNPAVNAVIADLSDHAERVLADGPSGPFAGVPMLLKDAGQEIARTPHWVGTPVLHRCGATSTETTPLVSAFERLGFVIIGKTNLPELSSGSTTEPAEFGPTHNPFDPERTAGGSSGGSAAAVAAGMVPIAHGGDATGSLRFPAAACGLFTLVPTRGTVAALPAAGMADPCGLWSEFVLTRTVRDLVASFEHLTGGRVPARSPRLRVGLLVDDPLLGWPVHADCAEAVRRVGSVLESLGHHVGLAHPAGLDGFFAPLWPAMGVFGCWGRATQAAWIERRIGRAVVEGDLSARSWEQVQRGRRVAEDELGAAVDALRSATLPLLGWWQDHDLLVTPTLRQPPWPIGEPDGPNSGGFPFPFSYTGQPTMNVPVVMSNGLPVGVQTVGAPGSDGMLLALARRLEEAFQAPRPPSSS